MWFGQFICQLDREFVRQFVDQHSGFYSWSTFSSSPSVSDDVGVLFENDRRQREHFRAFPKEFFQLHNVWV
jgi:hypothetical protein